MLGSVIVENLGIFSPAFAKPFPVSRNSMNKQEKISPEKRLVEISTIGFGKFKKIVAFVFLIIGYWQALEYFTNKPNINVYLENSYPIKKSYVTKISIINGAKSISKIDIIKPITIVFSDKIKKVQTSKNIVNSKFDIQKNTLKISFDLLNKDESFSFFIITDERTKIENIDGRIKEIEEIYANDYEFKPKNLKRFLNIWLVLFFTSIILFIDALLVILKDKELQKLFNFVMNYKLNKTNIEDYINNYGKLYSEWKVKIKPDGEFMEQIIRNLFISFAYNTKQDLEFIKKMTCIKTSMYSLYRVRTVFILVGPILFIVSFCAMILNYFYFEINGLSELISIIYINKILTTILMILGILVILFPSRTMNLIAIGKM